MLDKNARWDKYSTEREKHVMTLQRETTALADQLAKLRLAHSAGVSEIQQDKVSRRVTSLQLSFRSAHCTVYNSSVKSLA